MEVLLKEVFEDDFWIMPQTPPYLEAGVPYITSKNIKKGRIDFGNVNYISEEDYQTVSKNRPIKEGDILISMIGTLGETAVVKLEDGKFYGQNMFLVRLDKDKICDRYFLNYFNSNKVKRDLEKSQNQSTQRYLKANHIEDLIIPLPSLDEQRFVAKVLDILSDVIKKRHEELEELDNLIKSRFVEMFGNLVLGDKFSSVRQKIGDIAYVTKLAGFEFTKFIQYKGQGDIIMLRGLNCKKGHLVLEDIKWIDRETSDLLPRSKLYHGDILMTYAGTIGDVAIVDEDDRYHLAPNVAKIALHDKKTCNPVFLIHLFMYSHDYIMTFASQVAQASINMEKIRSFEYYFPPIELQNEFEAFVNQVDKLKFAVQQSLDETQTLMNSLMQQYFG